MGEEAMAWAAVVAAARKGADYHRQGIGRADNALADEMKAIVESTLSPSPPDELQIEREGARLALFGPAVQYQLPTLFAPIVEFWTRGRGVAFALSAALAALRWQRHTPDDYSNYGAWLSRTAKSALGWEHQGVWPELRRRYAEADANERARARDVARAARETASLPLRGALAFVVFDDDALWTEDDRRAVTRAKSVSHELTHYAILAECRRTNLRFGDDHPEADAIAKALGKDSFVALDVLYRWSPHSSNAAPLAALATPEALSSLVDPAHRKELGAIIAAGLRAAPKAAIEGLAPRTLRGARPLPPLAHALLVSLVAEHPAEARSSAAPAPAIDALVEEAGVELPIADPSELPVALARPPWSEAPKKAAKKTSTKEPSAPLVEIAFTESIDWGSAPPEARDDIHGWDPAELIGRIEDSLKKKDTVFLLDFTWQGVLDEKTALRLLGEIPTTQLYGQVDDIEQMLVAYGLAVLDPLLAYLKRQPDRLPGFRAVDSPKVAAIAAHAFATSKKNKEAAERWLDAHPRASAVHLLPILVRETGKARAPAEAAVRLLATKQRDVLDEVARALGPAATAAVDALVGATTAPEIPKKLPKLPELARVGRLPRPLLAGARKAISLDAATTLLHWLSISKLDAPQPALAELRRALDPSSLARFAFGLFSEWALAGGAPKEAWALHSLAPFGDAGVARALVPLARGWAPGGLPQRAQAVIDVLAAMGNDAALLGIHRLTKVQSRALAAHADKTLAKVATARGLGKDDLADRLVPDLGLDADGTKTFAIGTRTFSVRFDEELSPELVDADGLVLRDLPKPRKGNDEESAAFAIAEWKELEKSAKRLAKEQTARLETAMSTQRRFAKDHFETFFSRHPFVVHLARRLVWGAYDGDALRFAFRVADDGTYVTIDDRDRAVDAGARIGIVHPLELDADARRAWGDRLADYEVIQPFPQLGRELHEVRTEERTHRSLGRFDGKQIASGKILGLERSGWKREAAGQGGIVAVFEKTFGEVRARLGIDPGIYLGDPTMHPTQTIQGVVLGRRETLALGEVPPVVFSEVVRDLALALGE